MRECLFFLLLAATSVGCYAKAPEQKAFDINQLIEDAPEFSQEMPVDREMPWYIRVIETPASYMLFVACDLWDRFSTKSVQLARSAWFLVWRTHAQEAPNSCTLSDREKNAHT
jgi:hypothetical protein